MPPRRRFPLTNPAPTLDTRPMSTAPSDAPTTVGRMIIELTPNGTSRPVPRVTFDPVGMFTPGLVYDSLPYFAQEVERAQARVRYDAQHGSERDAPDTPRETAA